MRTKTLLIAVAALAVGVFSSQAQVYSQNIVGYANVPTLDAYYYYLLSCPFNVGVSNGANEIFGTTLPDYTQVVTWDEPSQNYITATYVSGAWYQADGATPGPTPQLLPGQGFFLYPTDVITNQFVGTVAVSSGATNTTTFNDAYYYYYVGSAVPFTGYVTNSPGVNLTSLPDYTQVVTWDEPTQSYITFTEVGGAWYGADGATPGPCPTVSVAQGFLLYPVDVYNWSQSLPSN